MTRDIVRYRTIPIDDFTTTDSERHDIIRTITDAMAVAVGAEIYNGADGTLFDWIEEVLTAGYAELKLSF